MTEIEVTQDDIAAGIRDNPNHCPIANAIRRTLGRSIEVYDDGWVDVMGRGHMELTPEVVAAIRVFDATGIMRPMKFELI